MDGPETMIALSAVARNSGPIALILLWGLLKIIFSWGWSGPPENIVLGPSQTLAFLLHVLTRLKPASSKNINCFHQHPALSPSKKTFTVGKTNTDNNNIECLGIFFLPTICILKLIIPEHIQSSYTKRVILFIIFH